MPTSGASFLAHHGNHDQAVFPDLLERIKVDNPQWRIGAAVPIPRYVPETSRRIVERLRARADYVIADPETHRLQLPYDVRGAGRGGYEYLQESDPIANRGRFVSAVMSAQRATGPSRIVTPWLVHGSSPIDRHLRTTLRFARAGHADAAANGESSLIGIAATATIIADTFMRDDLLDEIVELPGDAIYFRMLVTAPESFTQYRERDVLLGLREFVTALAANGKPTLLAQVGLCGWPFLAFGSLGFGSGIKGTSQKFAFSSGWGQPLEWYFLPGFLGFVLRDELQLLAAIPGFEPCSCPYCPDLLRDVRAVWDKNSAGAHYLWWCTKLANEAADAASIRARLSAAQAFLSQVQSAGAVLDPRSIPRHLEVWTEVVS